MEPHIIYVQSRIEAIGPDDDPYCSRCWGPNSTTGVVHLELRDKDENYIQLCASCLIECLNQLKDAM